MEAPRVLAARPPSGRRMKARAPPPPGKPALPRVPTEQKPPRDTAVGCHQNLIHQQETLRNSTLDVTVVLPSGLEKQSVVSGSHAMMDLLVELCLQNHLNPSHHALEIQSSETQQPLSFKPNTLVGTLNVHTVFLKEKIPEEKVKPGPRKVPEKSVRLVVNYLRTQKAVVRVSPDVPLQSILPLICAKCEVSPEHVVLLRDSAAGEELELSKSLSELGIKELYAWDNRRVLTKTQSEPSLSCRETFRKSSLGNDETDKEKKKFLGFFKVNKRSSSKGCLTMPNSPSAHPRSLSLGPSLSLGNISGVSVKSEMKKRRAPPPPGLGPLVQDKTSEKVSLGSQVDLQKKKRRAPAPPPPQPPPPSPLVPNRREDKEENRKSTMGVGRQVPQKPPRGTARGPPQLVLPPPPPYPPPDPDEAEPLSPLGESAGSEASELRPKLSLPLSPGSHDSVDGIPAVPSEAEETVSVGSCFASEDTTEDSGVMSSPSDIVSLDSQHDSLKSKDKWATDQEDCSDQDLAGTPELGPQKSPLWERPGPGNSCLRRNRQAVICAGSSSGSITRVREPSAQNGTVHTGSRAEAAVDQGCDLGTQDWVLIGKDTLFGAQGTLLFKPHRFTKVRGEKASVTSTDDLFIAARFRGALAAPPGGPDEVEDSYDTDSSSVTNSANGAWNHCVQDGVIADTDTIPVTFIGEVSDDPVDLGLSSNRNNNAGSSNTGGVTSKGPCLPSCEAERDQPPGRWTPPPDSSRGDRGGKATGTAPKVASLAAKLPTADPSVKEPGSGPGSAPGERTQASRRAEDKGTGEPSSIPGPPAWCQRGHTAAGSYGLKHGLTSYKIIPPRSQMPCYDRGVSLSTGAIKIDELGNLVSPPGAGGRTVFTPSSPGVDTEAQPLGKVKEFWRRGSMEKPLSQPMAHLAARGTPAATTTVTMATPTPTTASAKPSQDSMVPAAPTPAAPKQWAVPQVCGRPLEDRRSRPSSAVASQEKVPAVNAAEVPFLKPHRRTSSQHVALAIARRIGSMPAPANAVRQRGDTEKGPEARCPGSPGQPFPDRRAAAPGWDSEPQSCNTWQPSTLGPSNTQPGRVAGSHQKMLLAGDKDSPTAVHRESCSTPSHASLREPVSTRWSCGPQEKPSTRDLEASLVSDPACTLDRVHPVPTHPANVLTPSKMLANGSAWDLEPLHCPQVSSIHSHIVLETEDRPSSSPEAASETEGSFPPSIFGPKKKFRPVVQRPVPKDTCLHSALMEAIHAAGGKDKLRKTAEHPAERGPRTLSYAEVDSERSALLAAIRGHSGSRSLRKVSSSASAELRGCQDTAPPEAPPPPPAPQAPPAPTTAHGLGSQPLGDAVDARQALLDAIRSGSGAARLRKVPLLV
ncbi:protein cordon-bleu [Erethizon dorsatum]